MSDFLSLLADAGLTIEEIALDFGVSKEVARGWGRGIDKAPASVLQSLSVMSRFRQSVVQPKTASEVSNSDGEFEPGSKEAGQVRTSVEGQPYTAISLFSGAMGLDIGLDQTGRFKLLACVEKEKAFCETIRANIAGGRLPKELMVFHADMSLLDPQEVLSAVGLKPGELDVLVGGPPCQSFSTAGRRGSIEDPRGTLLWDFLRFVEFMQPKMFLMENVRGLLSAALKHRPLAERPPKKGPPLTDDEQAGSVVRLFAEDLKRSGGYHLDCFEVNAVNYGAPQLRERALFIGNRYNAKVDFPNPTHGRPAETSSEKADLFDTAPSLKPWATLRDALDRVTNSGEIIMDFSPRKKAYLEKIPAGSNWRSLPLSVQQESMGKAWHAKGGRSGWWRRLTLDLPCPTLVTMPNHASTSLCHPTETRALSIKEYAAIQEFPSDWTICGTTTQQYAQVGNAVPVRLGFVAGQVLAACLDKLKIRNLIAYERAPEHYRVVYIQSHVRTRQWFKKGETFVWTDGSDENVLYNVPVTVRQERRLAEHNI
jgi:DNA (cytosine-5)-methyltransferase 1